MPNGRIVEFQRSISSLPEPTPAKAMLRPDVRLSVQRSTHKLPVLGQCNPDAALLIERSIDDYIPPSINVTPPDGGGGYERSVNTRVVQESRPPEAELAEYYTRRRQIQADFIRRHQIEQRAAIVDEVLDYWAARRGQSDTRMTMPGDRSRHQIQAEYLRRHEDEQRRKMLDEVLDDDWMERQRRESNATRRMLRDQAGDLSAAS